MRHRKYITGEIKKFIKKYPLYSQDGKKGDAVAFCKFFSPISDYVAYVMEGEPKDEDDYTFFGIVRMNGYIELGYFSLSEIDSVTLPFGMKIERDAFFSPTKVSEIDEHGIAEYIKDIYS